MNPSVSVYYPIDRAPARRDLAAGGGAAFAPSAVEAVARWRFRPGRRQGQAVRTHLQVPVRFTLESDR